jgi:hypothetical protein
MSRALATAFFLCSIAAAPGLNRHIPTPMLNDLLPSRGSSIHFFAREVKKEKLQRRSMVSSGMIF